MGQRSRSVLLCNTQNTWSVLRSFETQYWLILEQEKQRLRMLSVSSCSSRWKIRSLRSLSEWWHCRVCCEMAPQRACLWLKAEEGRGWAATPFTKVRSSIDRLTPSWTHHCPWVDLWAPLKAPVTQNVEELDREEGLGFSPNMISHPSNTEFSAASLNKLLSFQPCLFQWSFDFHLMPPPRLSHFSPALSRSLSRRWHYNIPFKCLNVS